jgi:hypothetical protein
LRTSNPMHMQVQLHHDASHATSDVRGRFFDEPGSQIVTKARSTASANQKPPNGTSSGLPSRTDNNSGISASGSLAAG